jgi:hypothetical protein
VASEGAWRGYFRITDALWNPKDPGAPYALLFDSRTWTSIPPVPVARFRGFTYKVPATTLSGRKHPTAATLPDRDRSR